MELRWTRTLRCGPSILLKCEIERAVAGTRVAGGWTTGGQLALARHSGLAAAGARQADNFGLYLFMIIQLLYRNIIIVIIFIVFLIFIIISIYLFYSDN